MNDCLRHVLGMDARIYMRDQLQASSSLAACVREVYSVDQGTVWTPLPRGLEPERLQRFAEGGLFPPNSVMQLRPDNSHGAPPGIQCLVGEISEYLSRPNRISIFVHPLMRRHDPVAKRLRGSHWFVGEEVYPYVLSEEGNLDTGAGDRDRILAMLGRVTEPVPFVGVLSEVPVGLELWPAKDEIARGALRELADHASAVIVGAYDAEGYIVWQK
jgi:hypothetical protein